MNRTTVLTARQSDVAALVAKGMPNKRVAETLGISLGSVKVHLGAVFYKLGASNRTEVAVILAGKS